MTGPSHASCPCGSPLPYDTCCGPLLRGERQAPTAEALMRSRYVAYATGDATYVWRTWHPRTRPAAPPDVAGTTWTGLRVGRVEAGGPGDDEGTVAFAASHDGGVLRERSRFARRAGRWFYLDGTWSDAD